jgi:hypothetical protein
MRDLTRLGCRRRDGGQAVRRVRTWCAGGRVGHCAKQLRSSLFTWILGIYVRCVLERCRKDVGLSHAKRVTRDDGPSPKVEAVGKSAEDSS